MRHHPKLRILAAAVLAACALTACKGKNEYVPPPPPGVAVGKAAHRDMTEYLAFTGNTQSQDSVDLRARVQGFLRSQGYKDGDDVKKGQLLFLIEPEPYEAKVREAQGMLLANKARLARAEIESVRAKKLFAEKAGPDTDVVKWEAEREQAKADVESASAQLDIAKINLSYTRVLAPFDGRVSRRQVDPGNLVGATEKTLLATIISYDPMYVYFTLGERDLLKVMRRDEAKDRDPTDPQGKVYLEMGLGDAADYPFKGVLDYVGLGVDPKTGTVQLRGIFKNPGDKIAPGLFARVRAPLQKKKVLAVPETCIGFDQSGNYVLVLNDKNIVEQRPVTLGISEDGMRAVDKGLTGDERIILSGLQKVRPGAPATPMEGPAPAGKAPAGKAPDGNAKEQPAAKSEKKS